MARPAFWTLGLLLGACAGRPPAPPVPDGGTPPADALAADAHHARDAGADAREAGPTVPYPNADVTVELPYGGPEQTADVTVTARAGLVDVHLLIDTTQSFDGEIDELQSALINTLILGLEQRAPSLTVGVSRFEDVPAEPFGATTDTPFALLQAQTANLASVGYAVLALDAPLGFGGDRPEDWGEALYQVATGEGLDGLGGTLVRGFDPHDWSGAGPVGGVGFRAASTRVVVLATDAPAHAPGDYGAAVPRAHGVGDAVGALGALGARVVGIISASDVRASIEEVATQTGAAVAPAGGLCTTGIGGAARAPVGGVCPLVYEIAPDGSGLSQTIVDAIATLLDGAVYAEVHGEALGDANGFVTAVEAVRAAGEADPTFADRRPAGALDGVADTFTNVHASAQLTFRVHLRNERVRSTEFPQVFFVPLRFLGDGAVLTELTVRVIVPEGPKFDGGLPRDAGEAGDDAVDPDAPPPP